MRFIPCVAALALALLAGCGPTKMTTTNDYTGPLPKPEMIVVYDLAVAPNEVTLDKGIESEIKQASSGTPRTEEEMAIGRKVAATFSKKLVDQLQSNGFVVMRAADAHLKDDGNVMLIKGQFISINEGNRTERVVIGFGLGRTDVRAAVQISEQLASPGKPTKIQLVESLQTDAKSGYKPGVAVGAGAASMAGHVGAGLLIGGGMAVGSEAFFANVDADADRIAKQIASRIKLIYQARGWSIP
jgi:hypothetical protein